MQKKKTLEKENLKKNEVKSTENVTDSQTYSVDGVPDVKLDDSWSGLRKRYRRIWRHKMEDTTFRQGIYGITYICLNSALLGGILSQLPSTPFAIATAPIALVLGMAGGILVTSYTSGLDDFTNAHIGAVVGVLLTAYLSMVSVMSGSSLAVVAGIVMVGLWYIASLSVAAVGYGVMGRWVSDEYSAD